MPDLIIGACAFCAAGVLNTDTHCNSCGAPVGRALNPPGAAPTGIISSVRERIFTLSSDPDSWPVQGIDLSAWNGVWDFNVTREKAQFAFLRAGSGNSWLDPRMPTYRQDAINAGMVFGLYWFLRIGGSITSHLRSLYNVWTQNPGNLPPVLDAESTTLNVGNTTAWLWEIGTRAKAMFGGKTTLYSSPGWLNGNTNPNIDWSNIFNLWDAHWTNRAEPSLPHAFNTWQFWQWSADHNNRAAEYGMISGGDKDIDLNRYNGSVDLFNQEFGTSIEPIGSAAPPPIPVPIPSTDIEPLYQTFVDTYKLNIRSRPDAASNDIGTLVDNSEIPILERVGDWGRVEGWVHLGYTKRK